MYLKDDDVKHYYVKRKMHNVLLFGLDMITKDEIFTIIILIILVYIVNLLKNYMKKGIGEFNDAHEDDEYEIALTDAEKELQQQSRLYHYLNMIQQQKINYKM